MDAGVLQHPVGTGPYRFVEWIKNDHITLEANTAGSFHPGAIVIATLHTPREKFWGAILELSQSGLSIRGVDLSSFDDLVQTIKSGEAFTSGVSSRSDGIGAGFPASSIPTNVTWASTHGHAVQQEHIVMFGIPVQIIPAHNAGDL